MHIKYLGIQIKTEYHFIFVYCVYGEIYVPFYFYFIVFQCLSSIFNKKWHSAVAKEHLQIITF